MKIKGSETKGVTKISSYANNLQEATIVRVREYV